MFRVTIDRTACEGIFACLVRDDRIREDDDGLAGFDPDEAVSLDRDEGQVTATFTEGRERAEQAAAACPPNAITVETVETGDSEPADPQGVPECR